MKEKRAQFSSRFAVIATTVGSAVGLGNIWAFPYKCGVNGGAAFLLIYIACVLLIGIPVICAEFSIGRGTHKNVRGALRQLHSSRFVHSFSLIGLLASILILSFYSVVAGWTLEYLIEAISGQMTATPAADFSNHFSDFASSPYKSVAWTLIFLLCNYFIMRRGVKRGIERMSNILMPILFVILIIFCVHSFFLPEVGRGLTFLFHPDFSKITPSVVLGAMGQAFFSLSLGLSCLLIYASYFSDKENLIGSASLIAVLDTVVAVLAGVIIFPAVFSYGANVAEGPKLVYEVFPAIFASMSMGWMWAVLFFLLLFFAAITSTISMSEITIAFMTEEWGLSRKRASQVNTLVAMALGSLCALSFGVLRDFTIFGMTIFDLFEYISSNILLPLGGIVFAVLAGWVIDRRFIRDQLTNFGSVNRRLYPVISFLMRFVAPVAILLIFLYGLKLLHF